MFESLLKRLAAELGVRQEDVRSILLKNPSLDRDEIRHWLSEYDKALGEHFELRFQEILTEL